NWHHVLGTYTSSGGGTVKIYVDGVQDGTNTAGGSMGSDTAYLAFGSFIANHSASGAKYNGNLDELGFWNRVLSGSEITQLYNSGAGLTSPSTTSPAITATAIAGSSATCTLKAKISSAAHAGSTATCTARAKISCAVAGGSAATCQLRCKVRGNA